MKHHENVLDELVTKLFFYQFKPILPPFSQKPLNNKSYFEANYFNFLAQIAVAQPYPVVKEVKYPVEVRVPKPYPVEKVS